MDAAQPHHVERIGVVLVVGVAVRVAASLAG
jgi:hypothetical protein